jgi:hypothetical protein
VRKLPQDRKGLVGAALWRLAWKCNGQSITPRRRF